MLRLVRGRLLLIELEVARRYCGITIIPLLAGDRVVCENSADHRFVGETGPSTASERVFATGIPIQYDGAGFSMSHPLNSGRRSGKLPP
jgi:hypothetical protein